MKQSPSRFLSVAPIAYVLLVIVCLGGYYWTMYPTTNLKSSHEISDHNHITQQNGLIATIGDYHMELLLEPNGGLQAYILGKNEWETMPIEATEIKGEVIYGGDSLSHSLTLKAVKTPQELRGSSLFKGKLPISQQSRPHSIYFNVPIENRLYRARFSLQQLEQEHVSTHSMPEGLSSGSDEEKLLYLTPGGAYTKQDIELNGNTLPSIKFRGIRAEHDMSPKPKDPICPITFTKSNSKFYWWINGQKYLFCCPPCIDEFLIRAKQDPKSLKPPSAFIKQ